MNSKKEKKDFRVKFTGAQRTKGTTINKEMILPTTRLRSLNTDTQRSHKAFKSGDIDQEIHTDSQCETSKRQLQINPPANKVDYCNINTSTIITDFSVLSGFFEYEVSFKLVYRASNHDFSVEEFHQNCDAYEDTLTICLTEDNKIIGGFTPLPWEDQFHRNSTHFKTDFKRETFLFSVTDKAKYPLVKSLKNKAICCFKSYGPTFGGGYDLLIGDKCNELPNATSYFPRNFQHPKGANFNKRDFTGTSRKNFKLLQWQVFHVIKLHSLKTIEQLNFNHIDNDRIPSNQKSLWERIKATTKQIINALCNDN